MTKKELRKKYNDFKKMYKNITDELKQLVDENPRGEESCLYVRECIGEANYGFNHLTEWLKDTFREIKEP